jgi:hypothetical protein
MQLQIFRTPTYTKIEYLSRTVVAIKIFVKLKRIIVGHEKELPRRRNSLNMDKRWLPLFRITHQAAEPNLDF